MRTWPDTSRAPAPQDNNYRAALWLLGRHPRLADLAERIAGVVSVEDGRPAIDLDHLAAVLNGVAEYNAAWEGYEARHPAPSGDDDGAYYRWQEAGPKADDTVRGLAGFLVMSSGEVGSVRLLATLAADPAPFKVGYLASFDAEGQRLLRDWCAVTAGPAIVGPAPAGTLEAVVAHCAAEMITRGRLSDSDIRRVIALAEPLFRPTGGLVDVIAAALCAQEEALEADDEGGTWRGWSTDDVAGMLAGAVQGMILAAGSAVPVATPEPADSRITNQAVSHEFTFTVESRGEGMNWSHTMVPQTVRAWNLRDAIAAVAALPFESWFPAEGDEVATPEPDSVSQLAKICGECTEGGLGSCQHGCQGRSGAVATPDPAGEFERMLADPQSRAWHKKYSSPEVKQAIREAEEGGALTGPVATPTTPDPTHGRIDPDIQRAVEEMNPRSVGQRAAMESTLQARRDKAGPAEQDSRSCDGGDSRPFTCGDRLPPSLDRRSPHRVPERQDGPAMSGVVAVPGELDRYAALWCQRCGWHQYEHPGTGVDPARCPPCASHGTAGDIRLKRVHCVIVALPDGEVQRNG